MPDHLSDAEVVDTVSKKPPGRQDWYVVVGFFASQDRWVLRRDTWLTENGAREAAERLPKDWTDYQIMKIPGCKP